MHWNYGPPIICNCATLYYSSHKTSTLFTKFHNDVMFKQWFIDDIFITWVGTPEIFAEFKSEIFWIAYCENNMVEAIPQFPWSYNLHYPWLKHCNKDLPKNDTSILIYPSIICPSTRHDYWNGQQPRESFYKKIDWFPTIPLHMSGSKRMLFGLDQAPTCWSSKKSTVIHHTKSFRECLSPCTVPSTIHPLSGATWNLWERLQGPGIH